MIGLGLGPVVYLDLSLRAMGILVWWPRKKKLEASGSGSREAVNILCVFLPLPHSLLLCCFL